MIEEVVEEVAPRKITDKSPNPYISKSAISTNKKSQML
jgi:hypothetical protein